MYSKLSESYQIVSDHHHTGFIVPLWHYKVITDCACTLNTLWRLSLLSCSWQWASCKPQIFSPWTVVAPQTRMSKFSFSQTRRRSMTPRCTRKPSTPSSTRLSTLRYSIYYSTVQVYVIIKCACLSTHEPMLISRFRSLKWEERLWLCLCTTSTVSRSMMWSVRWRLPWTPWTWHNLSSNGETWIVQRKRRYTCPSSVSHFTLTSSCRPLIIMRVNEPAPLNILLCP